MTKTTKIKIPPEQKTRSKTKPKLSESSIVIYDINGKEKETVKLPKKIISVKVSPKAIARYVRVYLTNQRQGTASAKSRGEVAGSTRKIYRQKGTGRARHGDIKAPIFVGGGVAHPPKIRNYSLKINKKEKEKIFLAVFAEKLNQGEVYCVDGLLNIKAKTKQLIKILENLKLDKEKNILLVYPKEKGENLILAARNLENIDLCLISLLNPYQILKSGKIIFPKEVFKELINKYGN